MICHMICKSKCQNAIAGELLAMIKSAHAMMMYSKLLFNFILLYHVPC